MNRRTYEILAKWIAKQSGITIEFQPDVCPQASVKTKHIILPSNIKEENVYGALADLMHEAGHLIHTKEVPESVAPCQLSHGIFNAIEDIRVDKKNFRLLPNIREFYARGMEFEKERRKTLDLKEVPLHKKVLCNGIFRAEGFSDMCFTEPEVSDFENKHNVTTLMHQGCCALDARDWDGAKKIVDKLMKIFGFDKLPKIPLQGQGGQGDGKGQKGGQPCPSCQGTGKDGKGKKCDTCAGTGQVSTDISGLRDKSAVWATGQGTGQGVGNSELGEVAVADMTRNRFKDLLNVKEVRIVEEGTRVNTDNLTAFFTGQVDELFCEDKIEHKKKSKIVILMDGSGSMDGTLLDGSQRREVLGGCVKVLGEVLDEVHALEGINVDWLPRAFNTNYITLSKENWEKEYGRVNGGTCLLRAFLAAQKEILNDQEIDGNKLIVVFSDGDVAPNEIEGMRDAISKHGEDVRCMVIGIGSDINGAFSKDLIGDNIILAKESADLVLLETIMTLLGG